MEVPLRRFNRLGIALAACALAACADSQAPENTRSPLEADPSGGLPTLTSAKVVTAAVQPAPGPGQYSIDLRFINAPTTTQEARFNEAKAKWEGIISGDVPDVTGVIPARTCGNAFKTPTFNGTIGSVLIDVLLQPIDGPGAVLGAAGPCLVRNADNLSLYGIMFFDIDDLDFLEDLGFFDEVVIHEMGHVLGFGTLWNFGRNLLEGGAPDPRFIGPLAIAAYDDLGGEGTVPVEGDQGGGGTLFSHWDEATFFNELMTGFLNSSADANPLSDLSVASMGDLGYVVNLGTGDRYRLPRDTGPPSLASIVASQGPGLDLGRRERLIRPVAVVR
ncbi:MAG: hypothetical protein ACREM9_02930 [Gemmatimonadales bacterium]